MDKAIQETFGEFCMEMHNTRTKVRVGCNHAYGKLFRQQMVVEGETVYLQKRAVHNITSKFI